MAALALTIGGAALGGALLPGGVSLLGATLSGAAIGGAIGGIVGAVADQTLLAPNAAPQAGPRLTDVQVFASTEGAPILRVYGRFRVGPTLIWAGDIREERRRTETGGKGAPGIETTEYRYFATLALGLCEGEIAGIGRVWADGKLVDMGRLDWRLHRGGENQDPDPRIEADEGEGDTPGFRGLAYLVFEELPLEPFGNRVPQFTVEIIANASPLTAITMIPGAGEFAYDTRRVHKAGDFGAGQAENVHAEPSRADAVVALDQLGQGAPEMKRVSLVVTWHGDDLRCGACTLRPKVEVHGKQTVGGTWRVSGLAREDAETVSLVEGKPAFGGTPSDGSVFRQISCVTSGFLTCFCGTLRSHPSIYPP